MLGIFLGDFGAHNFYRSQIIRGTCHLLMLALVVGLFLQGNHVSRTVKDVAGLPAGIDHYILGLVALAANGLWRWVEVIIILATPEQRFVR